MSARLNWIDPKTHTPIEPGLVLQGKPVLLQDSWTGGVRPVELTLTEEETGDPANKAWSPVLQVTACRGALSNSETAPWRPALEIGAGTPAAGGWIKVDVPFGNTTTNVLEFYAITDPSVTCKVLSAWDHGAGGLIDYIHNEEPEIRPDDLRAEFVKTFGSDVLKRPKALNVWIEQPTFEVAERTPHPIALRIVAGSASKSVLVVQAVLDGDPSQALLSDLIEVGAVATGTARVPVHDRHPSVGAQSG